MADNGHGFLTPPKAVSEGRAKHEQKAEVRGRPL